MAKNWVEFSAIKQSVTMRMVLDHYQVKGLKESRGELRGRCPISRCKDDDPFSANVSKNCFQCFVCKKRGNVLDLVAAMENCGVRDAAVKLADWFSVASSNGSAQQSAVSSEDAKTSGSNIVRVSEQAQQPSRGEATAENKPLTFQLQGVNPSHGYITDRGITPQTAAEFGIGFFSGKGSMSGRVVIPIHNERGELVAYAGRSIDGSEPRYKFPAGFHKAAVLFNLHRVESAREVVLVEGFFDCMKLWQAGFAPVALMGCSLSEQQERLLVECFQIAVLLLDGDEAGQRGTDECLLRLGRRMWVKAVVVPEGKQPDTLSVEELLAVLK